MKIHLVKKLMGIALVMTMFSVVAVAVAQDKPADNMQILRDKIRADKKLVIATVLYNVCDLLLLLE